MSAAVQDLARLRDASPAPGPTPAPQPLPAELLPAVALLPPTVVPAAPAVEGVPAVPSGVSPAVSQPANNGRVTTKSAPVRLESARTKVLMTSTA